RVWNNGLVIIHNHISDFLGIDHNDIIIYQP
ncbi:MAG: hypothetical protein ACI9OS_000863, partial [Ulvibacter sp.]